METLWNGPVEPGWNPDLLSPLDLAFVGDCVYELLVREYLVEEANRPTADLNAAKVRFVNAEAQEDAINLLMDSLTDGEAAVFRRGRNAHTARVPKHASVATYHAATGLEALFGWLYLKGDIARLRELFAQIADRQTNGESL
ncbi:MAG: ribonuclease III [Clostridia bacterium]|nr:ribonuclease III [Clostridia bacterium]